MRCQWEAYIKLLPGWLQEPVNRLGRDALTELRLRIGQPPQLIFMSRSIWLGQPVTKEDIDFVVEKVKEIVARLRDMSPLYEDFMKKQK